MINERVQKLKPSGIREFFELVLGMKDVISLGVGEPDFITPWNIRERAIFSLEEGYTSYTSNKGLFSLRKTISSYLKKHYGLSYDPNSEILITVGVSQGLDLAIRTLVNEKDKVLIFEPFYVSYPAISFLQGAQNLFLKLEEPDFKIKPKKLYEALRKYKPKIIILNYPTNPTGVSYTKEELRELWKIIKKFECLVISDEIYDRLSYDFPHTPFPKLSGAQRRTVYLSGFSKNFAMTGFRIGFAAGSSKIIEAMTKIHQYSMLCAPITSQMAALEALERGEKELEIMRKEYVKRRGFVIEFLNEIGLKTVKPNGAFYCFSSIEKSGLNSMEFAKRLLLEKKVAVVPGIAFGNFENFIRITYAQEIDVLKEALNRIKDFLASL